jgi:glycosyltransferase involved in cell wall biosynthesis
MSVSKVTVTIPSYNQPLELDRALTALANQTFKDFSVVILDDCSSTNLHPFIEKYSSSFPISILRHEKNLGAMKNLEYSIFYSTESEYIFSHHEDDYISPTYLQEAVTTLDENQDISFVLTSAIWVKRSAQYSIDQNTLSSPKKVFLNSLEFMERSLKQAPFIFGSVVYRRKQLVGTFELDRYYTLCDKVFLIKMLLAHKGSCCFFKNPYIFVTDHTEDKKDLRSVHARPEYLINYLLFYKENMPSTLEMKKLFWNNALLGFYYLPGTKSFRGFLIELKKYDLYHPLLTRSVGLYALAKLLKQKIKTSLV